MSADDKPNAEGDKTMESYREFLKAHIWKRWESLETDQRKQVPKPPNQKPYPEDAELIDLVAPEDMTVGGMPLIETINSRRQTFLLDGRLWAGGQVLVWQPVNKGETRTFTFSVTETGKKRVHMVLALTSNSGRISFFLDGEKTTLANKRETLDLYRPYRTLLRNFTLLPVELEAGSHTLTIKFEGAIPQVNRPEIGIDFLWIQKQ